MPDWNPRANALFVQAIDRPPADRPAFLARECGDDAGLRKAVETLLRANEQAEHFLAEPPVPAGADVTRTNADADATADPDGTRKRVADAALTGVVIAGRYRLLERIGEGGMGSVWMAEQTEPVKRKVAVKLIKAGLDSKTVLARFEAERQALAMMDHPNIAKVLDGGLTGEPSRVSDRVPETRPLTGHGSPYFVMELVKGVPITEFCDARKLTPQQRLELFVPVCQAIQHAHQKGVIHRDIKPANVLVALYDDKPVPKVIDFGVAKATGPTLTEHTLNTGFGGVVGTPQYMSPEQATFNNLDIDTRSDVYSLGVLLYELLAGSPPFASAELKKRGLLEMLRVVREDEPPRPSIKLSSADALPSLSASRGTEPKKLTGLLRNELDWIVMKALEKDRTRRYETANGFAADVTRYLSGEPVQAHPPSTGYRLKKFVRRHKGQVIAASLVLAALLAGVAGTTLGLIEAKRQTHIARTEAEAKEIARQAEAEQRGIAQENERKALVAAEAETTAKERERTQRTKAEKARDRTRNVLDAMVSEVSGDSLTTQKEISAEQKKFLQGVLGYYREFASENADDIPSRIHHARAALRVGLIEFRLGRKEQSAAAYRTARDGYASLAIDFPAVLLYQSGLAASQSNLGMLLTDLGQREEAEKQYRKGLEIFEKLAADVTVAGYQKELANIHNSLGILLVDLGQRAEAEEQYRKAVAITQKLATDFPSTPSYQYSLAMCYNNLGLLLKDLGQRASAEEHHRKAMAVQEKLVASFPAKPEYRRGLAKSHNNLGALLADLGQSVGAEEQYRKATAVQDKLVTDFPTVPAYQVELGLSYKNSGTLLSDGGNPAESLKWFGRAIDCVQPVHEKEPRDVTAKVCLRDIYAGRAASHFRLQKFAEAVKDWDRAIALSPPDQQPRYRANRATSRVNAGMVDEAVSEVAELTKAQKWKAAQWYDFACVYSVASGKIADKKQEYADRAMQLLHHAVEVGYKNTPLVKSDTDLDPLRGRDDFKKLLADLEAKSPPKPEVLPPPRRE